MINNILQGEEITTDDTVEYSLSTLEKQREFDKNRNYTYEWNGVSPSVNAQWNCTWDNWKSNKDIV